VSDKVVAEVSNLVQLQTDTSDTSVGGYEDAEPGYFLPDGMSTDGTLRPCKKVSEVSDHENLNKVSEVSDQLQSDSSDSSLRNHKGAEVDGYLPEDMLGENTLEHP